MVFFVPFQHHFISLLPFVFLYCFKKNPVEGLCFLNMMLSPFYTFSSLVFILNLNFPRFLQVMTSFYTIVHIIVSFLQTYFVSIPFLFIQTWKSYKLMMSKYVYFHKFSSAESDFLAENLFWTFKVIDIGLV